MKLNLLPFLFFFLGVLSINAQEANVYSTDKVHEIRIDFQQSDWDDHLDSMRLYGDGLLLAKVNIDGKTYNNCGVRYRGTKTFKTNGKRNPLHIKLNYINKTQNHQGFQTFKLSNALRDPSMLREVLSYEIAGKYLPTPKAGFAKVYVNNEFYGMLVNVEDVGDDFLTRNFGSSDNSFFKCSAPVSSGFKSTSNCKNKIYSSLEYEDGADCYIANYQMKSEEGWDDLIELTKVLKDRPQNIEKVLNVDRTLWMLAFNNAVVNLNSYTGQNSQNYYLYKDSSGQFNPVIWDLNLSFGSYKNTGSGSDLNLKQLQELDPLLHEKNVTKPLISQLLVNPQYKKIYLAHLRTIAFDWFVNETFEKRAKELQRLISNATYEDKNKGYQHNEFLVSLEETIGKRSKIPGLLELMNRRGRFLKKHPQLTGIPPAISDVVVKGREKFSNQTVDKFRITAKVEKRAKKVKLYYRFSDKEAFQMAFMGDDGKHNDGGIGDKVFGTTIEPKGQADSIEYYIVAENAVAISYFPNAYMFSPLVSSLEELNQ